MANNYKEVDIFIAQVKGEVDTKSPELAEARETMKELASKLAETKDKGLRTEMGEILTTVVNEGFQQKTNYIDLFADTARTGLNVRQNFEYIQDGTSAEFTAKGVVGERGTISKVYDTITTKHISTRPYIQWLDLKSGRINFDDIVLRSVEKMETLVVQDIETTMYNAFVTFASPNYETGSGLNQTLLKGQIDAFSRASNGAVSLIGDVTALSGIDSISGFSSKLPESLALQYNRDRFIGVFHSANVVQLPNPFIRGSLTDTILRTDLVYIVPSGNANAKPLKIQYEGDIWFREQEDFITGDWEQAMGMIYGAKVMSIDTVMMGMYVKQ
jgi:hypothetical protein